MTLSQRIDKYGGDLSYEFADTMRNFFRQEFHSTVEFNIVAHEKHVELDIDGWISDDSPFVMDGQRKVMDRLDKVVNKFFNNFIVRLLFSLADQGQFQIQIAITTEDQTHLIPLE